MGDGRVEGLDVGAKHEQWCLVGAGHRDLGLDRGEHPSDVRGVVAVLLGARRVETHRCVLGARGALLADRVERSHPTEQIDHRVAPLALVVDDELGGVRRLQPAQA
jgi:hypothetical protein